MKTVVVTGGTRGIGFSTARVLLQRGYRVVITGRSQESLSIALVELEGDGEVAGTVLDISCRESVREFAAGIDEIYALVNNAGHCQTFSLTQSEGVDPWDKILDVNLNGPYWLTKALVGKICDAGRIVNLSSQLGQEGRRNYSAYCASKFALIGLTKCWAKELGDRAITVNAVCPGWVDTDMGQTDLERIAREKEVTYSEYKKEICEPLELKRFTSCAEVAALIVFLVSPEASGVTGRDWLMNTIWNSE